MMIFSNFTKTDTYFQVKEGDNTMVFPLNSVILVDDESGFVALKNIASRKTVALIKKSAFE